MSPRSGDGKVRRQPGRAARESVARLTCANCRRRKVRCDGQQPECRICQAYERHCQYDKPPSLAQAVAMAKRIEELEEQAKHANQPGQVNDSDVLSSRNHGTFDDFSPATSSSNLAYTSYTIPGTTGSFATPGSLEMTSAISPLHHSTASMRTPASSKDVVSAGCHDRDQALMQPINDQQMAFWEAAAIETAATYLHLSVSQISQLLRLHWTWIHPVMLFVPRSIFLRDLASNGPYASKLLLSVMCLHGARFTQSELASDLEARVRLLIAAELFSKPSVPTVQALLQLSAREIGRGEVSLAWSFSGMAFRMAIDMGIFTQRAQPGNDTLQARVTGQLAWSCYVWDKSLSLYLGRVPVLRDPPSFEPRIVDETAELTPWSPHPINHPGRYSNVQPLHLHSSFVNFCRLNVIIFEILLEVYGPNPSTLHAEILPKLGHRLREWRRQLPQHLVFDGSSSICLPPQVVILNLLYHTTVILLHRPFVQADHCKTLCRESAQEIVSIFQLFDEAFGMSSATYMMAYCAYAGATVAVLDLHKGVPHALQSVSTCLKVLNSTRASCPGVQSGIDIIVNGMAAGPTAAIPSGNVADARGANLTTGLIPHTVNRQFRPPTSSTQPAETDQTWPTAFPAFPFEPSQAYIPGNDTANRFSYMGSLDPFACDWTNATDLDLTSLFTTPG